VLSNSTNENDTKQEATGATSMTRSGHPISSKRKRTNESTLVSQSLDYDSLGDILGEMHSLMLLGREVPKLRTKLQEKEIQRKMVQERYNDLGNKHNEAQANLRRMEKGIFDRDVTIEKLKTQVLDIERMRALDRVHTQHDSEGIPRSWATPSIQFESTDNRENRAQQVLDDLMRTIWIPRDSTHFPGPLEPEQILREWRQCRDVLSSIFIPEHAPYCRSFEARQAPEGFTSFLAKLFGTTRAIPIYDSRAAMRILDEATFSEVLQAHAMDLLCEKIFLANDWHGTLFGETTNGMLYHMRKMLSVTTGEIIAGTEMLYILICFRRP